MEKTGVSRKHVALILLVLALGLGFPRPAEAQQGYTISLDQLVVEPGGGRVTAFISVLDPAGRPVDGLTGFSATIDDTAAEIESIEAAVNGQIPIAALLAIDVSGSMAGAPVEQAKAAASAFIQDLPPDDVVSVLPFGGEVGDAQPFTSDQEPLLDAITALSAQQASGTALHDALAVSLETIASAPTDRRAIVLLTDGRDSGGASERSREEVIRSAATARVPVFAIALGVDADASFLLEAASVSTGGLFLAPALDDVPDVLAAVGTRLRGQYGLTIAVPESARATPRELAVRIEAGGQILTARSTFDPQAATASSDGGGSPTGTIILMLVFTIAVVALGTRAAFWYRRRRQLRRQPKPGRGTANTVPSQPYQRQAPDVPFGELAVISGPNAGATVPLASQPVDIGASQDCALRLDPIDGTALHHARVWLQRDRFVLHHLAAGAQTLVGDRPVEWATLESDDTLQIGPHIIVVRLRKDQSLMS